VIACTRSACFETRAEERAPQHEVLFIFLTNPNLHPEEAAFAAVSKDPLRLPASLAQKSLEGEGPTSEAVAPCKRRRAASPP
jgi:hypothetical protein